MTRKAKKPNSIQVSDLNLSDCIVCQTKTANTPSTNSAIHILPLPAELRSTTFTSNNSQLNTHNSKLNGAQGRIRTSVAHNAADLQSAAINHSATCALFCSKAPWQHPSQPIKPVNDSTCESRGNTNLEGVTG